MLMPTTPYHLASDENLPVFTGILAILVCLGEWYGILVCENGMCHLGFLALAATWFLGGSYIVLYLSPRRMGKSSGNPSISPFPAGGENFVLCRPIIHDFSLKMASPRLPVLARVHMRRLQLYPHKHESVRLVGLSHIGLWTYGLCVMVCLDLWSPQCGIYWYVSGNTTLGYYHVTRLGFPKTRMHRIQLL